jgi:hypothetical protein
LHDIEGRSAHHLVAAGNKDDEMIPLLLDPGREFGRGPQALRPAAELGVVLERDDAHRLFLLLGCRGGAIR